MDQDRRSLGLIMIIDDDDELRATMAAALSSAGYLTVEAESGLHALQLLQNRCSPGLILLDLRMPQMDARQFRGMQLSEPTLASIPVVLLADPNELQDQEARLTPVACLLKPFHTGKLLATVAAHCMPDACSLRQDSAKPDRVQNARRCPGLTSH